ncbi:MAG TPA: 2-amino-4-hydroxy-6-hydroxymethyldihydropteridine diphosphokinase [Gemmatimonadales bacterium]|jgi:2-amino-4-hydroxy-6-hydroxymethyldihydropteridine diphosphokinase|nr:2-amino-4-hydroxy-6-hydroxymethyldihydropteridine diphosphokinase [Gemmatimonadales bacterium]
MSRAYIALGSNLGNRAANLALARERLAALPGNRIAASSAIEETEPLGGMAQPAYLNQMLLLETDLSPRALLEICRAIELAAGRVRHTRWEPRTLDIDIVRYGDTVVDEPDLQVPHPGLRDREFWKREIAEIERSHGDDTR